MGFEEISILFFVTSMLCYFIIRDALKEVLRLSVGRKDRYRKIIKEQTLLRKISLTYIKNYIKRYQILCKVLELVHNIYIIIILLFLTLYLLFIIGFGFPKIINSITMIKVIFMDIPILIFFFIKTGHDKKHGGVKWKF